MDDDETEIIRQLIEIERKLTARGIANSGGHVSLSDAVAYILHDPQKIDPGTLLDELLGLREFMARAEWLTLLGQFWPGADNTTHRIPELRAAIGEEWPVMEMMTREERLKLERLPQTITVYRGCGAFNATGICWSLSSTTAKSILAIPRYEVDAPLLLTGTVDKAKVVAFKHGIKEAEIISFDVVEVTREAIQK